MVAPLVAAAGIGAASGFLSDITSAFGQYKANKDNKAMAREQMNFQRDMSNSQFQRARKDLEDAGLNPLLALPGGASTPSGASSTSQNVAGNVGKTATTALEAARLQREFESMDSIIKVNNSQADLLQANTAKSAAETQRINQDIYGTNTSAKTVRSDLWEGAKNMWNSFKYTSPKSKDFKPLPHWYSIRVKDIKK